MKNAVCHPERSEVLVILNEAEVLVILNEAERSEGPLITMEIPHFVSE